MNTVTREANNIHNLLKCGYKMGEQADVCNQKIRDILNLYNGVTAALIILAVERKGHSGALIAKSLLK